MKTAVIFLNSVYQLLRVHLRISQYNKSFITKTSEAILLINLNFLKIFNNLMLFFLSYNLFGSKAKSVAN